MATINPVVLPLKVLKDGTNRLRIAVRHRQQTSYIVTNIRLDNEKQLKNGKIVRRPDAAELNKKLRAIMDRLEERLESVRNLSLYTCVQLKNMLENNVVYDAGNTFKGICDSYVKKLEEEGRHSYATLMQRSGRYFCEFCMGDIAMEDITPSIIRNFIEYLKKSGKKDTYINIILSHVKVIVNRAVYLQIVSYDSHPFSMTRISPAPVRDLDLPLEDFLKIMNSEPETKKMQMARDLFMISFMLGGMNLCDIMKLDFRLPNVEYVRQKSAGRTQSVQKVCFDMPKDIMSYAGRWMDTQTGKLDFGYNFTYHNFSQYVSYSLTDLCRELGIQHRVIFYSARKCFAQFASEIGMPESVINYCLGHSDRSKGVIRYYTKVRSRQATMCLERVYDYVCNPDKYRQYIELRSDIMMMMG